MNLSRYAMVRLKEKYLSGPVIVVTTFPLLYVILWQNQPHFRYLPVIFFLPLFAFPTPTLTVSNNNVQFYRT